MHAASQPERDIECPPSHGSKVQPDACFERNHFQPPPILSHSGPGTPEAGVVDGHSLVTLPPCFERNFPPTGVDSDPACVSLDRPAHEMPPRTRLEVQHRRAPGVASPPESPVLGPYIHSTLAQGATKAGVDIDGLPVCLPRPHQQEQHHHQQQRWRGPYRPIRPRSVGFTELHEGPRDSSPASLADSANNFGNSGLGQHPIGGDYSNQNIDDVLYSMYGDEVDNWEGMDLISDVNMYPANNINNNCDPHVHSDPVVPPDGYQDGRVHWNAYGYPNRGQGPYPGHFQAQQVDEQSGNADSTTGSACDGWLDLGIPVHTPYLDHAPYGGSPSHAGNSRNATTSSDNNDNVHNTNPEGDRDPRRGLRLLNSDEDENLPSCLLDFDFNLRLPVTTANFLQGQAETMGIPDSPLHSQQPSRVPIITTTDSSSPFVSLSCSFAPLTSDGEFQFKMDAKFDLDVDLGFDAEHYPENDSMSYPQHDRFSCATTAVPPGEDSLSDFDSNPRLGEENSSLNINLDCSEPIPSATDPPGHAATARPDPDAMYSRLDPFVPRTLSDDALFNHAPSPEACNTAAASTVARRKAHEARKKTLSDAKTACLRATTSASCEEGNNNNKSATAAVKPETTSPSLLRRAPSPPGHTRSPIPGDSSPRPRSTSSFDDDEKRYPWDRRHSPSCATMPSDNQSSTANLGYFLHNLAESLRGDFASADSLSMTSTAREMWKPRDLIDNNSSGCGGNVDVDNDADADVDCDYDDIDSGNLVPISSSEQLWTIFTGRS
ncbi:hypothetical protein VTJ49DRAFT_4128 [Mycothermus thermophilus]|uniref:Uncharacterized protein n=1 Tax=Humicola insolens TaxID=85995 RepID=A0ABR3VLP0_HUMIN